MKISGSLLCVEQGERGEYRIATTARTVTVESVTAGASASCEIGARLHDGEWLGLTTAGLDLEALDPDQRYLLRIEDGESRLYLADIRWQPRDPVTASTGRHPEMEAE